MDLQNPFSIETRCIFMYTWECWLCGENGQRSGGLELHHIFSRISASPLNAAILCKLCHSHIGHTIEEEQTLLRKTINFLVKEHYKLTEKDEQFLTDLSTNGRLRGFIL